MAPALISLTDGWTLWPWVCLRGAGFPAHWMERLRLSRDVLGQLDALWQAEARVEEMAAAAIASAETQLEAEPEQKKSWQKVLKKLRRPGEGPLPVVGNPDVDSAIQVLSQAKDRAAQVRASVHDALTSDVGRIRGELRKLSHEPLLREALAWQNRGVLHGSIGAFAEDADDGGDEKTRRRELTLATYLQRYCLKNDTIGFFGPVGWGRLTPEGPAARLEPGPSLVRRRTVYFEYWAIDALARALSTWPELKPYLLPRTFPRFYVQDRTLYQVGRKDDRRAVALRMRMGGGSDAAEAYATNLSPGGMFIRSDAPEAVGTRFSFEAPIAPGANVMRGTAEVRWVRQVGDPNGPPGMGVQFDALDERTRALVEEMIAAAAPLSGEKPVDLQPLPARLLKLCTGERMAKQIAAEVLADPACGVTREQQVYAELERLAADGIVSWALEIPTAEPYPELWLEQLLQKVEPEAVRRRALELLAALKAARDRVRDAAGDANAVDNEIGALGAEFARITGLADSRKGGETYAARTLVYEDCLRDVDLELGPGFTQKLAPALSLLLQSARWYTYTIATRFEAAVRESYQALRRETRAQVVEFRAFFERVAPQLSNARGAPSIISEVVEALHARWAAVLGVASARRELSVSSAAISADVHRAFNAPGPGWPTARYHSPDVLIAAESVDAINRGEYQIVLGELHAAFNTLVTPFVFHQHPSPAELLEQRERDVRIARIGPVMPKESPGLRTTNVLLGPEDFHLEAGDTRSYRPRALVLQLAALVVDERDGRVVIRTRDGSVSLDAMVFFDHHLGTVSTARFGLLEPAQHQPRVTIDEVVVSRERWTFERSDLGFADEKTATARFIAANAFARAQDLPARVFIKIPEEPKPVFIDLASPVLVELLCKMARKASTLSLSEMLPEADRSWLTDREGRRYTSELRIAAVDPVEWSPGPPLRR